MISRIYRKELWKAGVSAAVLAAGVNVAVFMSARAAGADFVVVGQPSPVSAGHVATASVTTILAATVVAAFARTPRRVRILRFGALAVAVLSLGGPLSMGSGMPTKLALALMHLIVAGTFVCALQRTLEPARAPVPKSTLPGSALHRPPIVQPSDPAELPTTEENRRWPVTELPPAAPSMRLGDAR